MSGQAYVKIVSYKYGNFNEFFAQIMKNSGKMMNYRYKMASTAECDFSHSITVAKKAKALLFPDQYLQ